MRVHNYGANHSSVDIEQKSNAEYPQSPLYTRVLGVCRVAGRSLCVGSAGQRYDERGTYG